MSTLNAFETLRPRILLQLRQTLQSQLAQGLDQRRLAAALALGISFGLLPCFFGASLLCALFAAQFRLNQLIVQLVNYLLYPVQLFLLLPYFKLGTLLFPGQGSPHDLAQLIPLVRAAPLEFMQQLWRVNLQAIGVWLLTLPLLWWISFHLALSVLQRLKPCGNNPDPVV